MFNFGRQPYVQLGSLGSAERTQNGPMGNAERTQSDSSTSATTTSSQGGTSTTSTQTGDVAMSSSSSASRPEISVAMPTAVGPNMGGDSGRVQVPIGMVADSQVMRRWQVLALLAFSAVQILLFVAICIAIFLLWGLLRFVVIALGGGAWLALLLFNLRLAGHPRRVIQSFLQSKKKTHLSPRIKKGSVVVVRGAVSLLHEELLSTEFHNVPGLVLVESSLRTYHPGARKNEAWTEHVRQTRAVDFRITDASSGTSAVVRAFVASESGDATPLVHTSTEVPLSTAVPISPPGGSSVPTINGVASPRPVETEERRRRRASANNNPQLMVCKGYIRQGQVVTVMGELTEMQGSTELYISPLTQAHNVSKMLLYKGLFPFFFPTWVSGLVISDQRDLS